MAIYGYARVGADGQTIDAQVAALTAAGAAPVFHERANGAKTDRRELAKALRALEAGDTLLVTRLDRLARSTRDLLNIPGGYRVVTGTPYQIPILASRMTRLQKMQLIWRPRNARTSASCSLWLKPNNWADIGVPDPWDDTMGRVDCW
jgi:hypothetical protein